MKIRSHRESHIVELDDGSTWRIFPGTSTSHSGDRRPISNSFISDDEVSSHALISVDDNSQVRVLSTAENWSVKDVKTELKNGSTSPLDGSCPHRLFPL